MKIDFTIGELHNIQIALGARLEWLENEDMSPDDEPIIKSALAKIKALEGV